MRADARLNRDAIIEASIRLQARRAGPVPLSTVAREAGVGIATLYRHFPSHEDLVVGMMERLQDRIVAVCERHLPVVREQPEKGWREFALELAALKLGALVPNLAHGLDLDHLSPELEAVQRTVFETVGRVLAEAQLAGLVRDEVTPLEFHVGLGILSRPLPDPEIPQAAAIQAWLLDTFLRGLRPD